MKTDDLIDLLSTNVEPVDRRQVVRTVALAVVLGGGVVLAAVYLALGVRADLSQTGALASIFMKLALTFAVLVPASVYLIRLTRPGGERRMVGELVAFPFVAVMALALFSLALAPSSHWSGMIIGGEWLECLVSIPIIAVVPFAVITWVVRRMAPTDLARTGAVVGLVAGCLSATGYALHCVDDSVPFVALWFGGTIALCTFAGWQLGPRLLRW